MFFYGFVLMVFVHWIPVFETVQKSNIRLFNPPCPPCQGGIE